MSITIENKNNSLLLTFSEIYNRIQTGSYYITKDNIVIKVINDYVIILNREEQFKINYNDVTSPSAGSAMLLAELIQGYLGVPINSASKTDITTMNSAEISSTFKIDAFGRTRVSEPVTLFDSNFLTNRQLYNWAESSYGTHTHQPGKTYIEVKTESGVNGNAIRQTRQYFRYQPGKSILIMMTGVLEVSGGQTDIKSRIGYYDSSTDKTVDDIKSGDGYFFELDGTALGVVQRSFTSGSEVNTRVEQKDFNIDTVDGTGNSGMTIDPSMANIFWIEQEWLGVGSVVMGFVYQRNYIPVHVFYHANLLQVPYTSRATLPVRYEIIAENNTTNVGELRQICCAVLSEGGFEPKGHLYSVGSEVQKSNIPNYSSAQEYNGIIAIRKKAARVRSSARVLGFELLVPSAGNIKYILAHYQAPDPLPFITTTWISSDDNSVIEYSYVDGTVVSESTINTNAIRIYVGFTSNNKDHVIIEKDKTGVIANDIEGNSDIYVLYATGIASSSEDVFGSIFWQEYE